VDLLGRAKSQTKPPIPIEETVEVTVGIESGRIVGMAWNGKDWNRQDITEVVNAIDRERLLSLWLDSHRKYWFKVGRKMKLW
jgi:hypothetical protein